jgi:hypothetical protein
MTARERLSNRRGCETFCFSWRDMSFTASVGRFPDGRIAEVFLSNGKVTTDADVSARDSAIVMSIALQHGANIETLRGALLRDSHGAPSGPLGLALDILAADEGAGA